MISTTRRRTPQSAGLGSPSGLRPYSASGAGRTARDAYDELGIRPVVNLQGTYTTWLAARPDGRRFPLPPIRHATLQHLGPTSLAMLVAGNILDFPNTVLKLFSSSLSPEINADECSEFH